MNKIFAQIKADLQNSADEKIRQSSTRYFKEKIVAYGVTNAKMKKIGRDYWPQIKNLPKKEVYELFESMLKSDYCEEAYLVASWLPKFAYQFERDDLKTFEFWIDKYLNNWAKIDTFCNHTIADHLEKFPDDIGEIKSWTNSKNRWMRRAAAVSLILPVRRGKYLKEVFEISDALIADENDMVRKGYGWLLKEASRLHKKQVFDYVMKNKTIMPRVALRYAIEKMPPELRAKAMLR